MSKYKKHFVRNKKFGSWTVISDELHKDERSRMFAYVQCSCGTSSYVECRSLLNETSTRCKQCNYSYEGRGGSQNPNWKGWEDVPKTVSDRVSEKYRLSSVLSPIVIQELYNRQNGTCSVTGQPVQLKSDGVYVVKIDNSGPLTYSNTAIVSDQIYPVINAAGDIKTFYKSIKPAVMKNHTIISSSEGE